MKKKIKQYDWRKYDFFLLIAVIILCLIGLFAVRCAGGESHGMDYLRNQLFGMVVGIVIVAVLSILDYHFVCHFVIIYYVVGILLTLAVKSPIGTDNNTDTYRWVKIFGITFQPSELMKILFILSLAMFFTKLRARLDRISTFIIAIAVTLVPMYAILSQPDLSSSLVIFFIMCVVMIVAGVSYRILAPVFILSIPISLVMFWYIQQPYQLILKSYQYNRIMAWLHPDNDPGQLNLQQNKALRAISSGGLLGKFIQDGGKATTSRVYTSANIPVRESDFIWAVVGEEFGFFGCCMILLLFAFIIFRCLMIARKAQDYTGRLIAIGVASMFSFQLFVNICVVTRIFPNTGLPLPFMSQGISSMLSSMMGIGFVMNICIQPAKSSKGGFSMRNSSGSGSIAPEIDFDLEL
ncbi:MAG: rod shape-determining protein RodA [Lachnospiraceae bacterium]|nr:rod shape-determining protein RodA [Lachnospiraceae bacterium]